MSRRYLNLCTLTAGLFCVLSPWTGIFAQSSSGTASQTVNNAQTVTSVHPTPTLGKVILPGQSVTLNAVVSSGLSTPGILTPTQTIQFNLNGSAIGSPVTVTDASATNLLPYSQAFTKWSLIGAMPPSGVSDNTLAGPFDNGNCTGTGCSNTTASTIVFPAASTSNPVGISYNVPAASGPALASKTVIFSVWTQAATKGTLTIVISDGNGGNAVTGVTIPVVTTWHRFEKLVTIPATFLNGFTVAVESTSTSAQTVNLQGAQFEQSSIMAGPYALTNGASATATGAVATYVLSSGFSVDTTHSTNATFATYSGDNNYTGSTSPTSDFNVQQATATVTLAAVPAASTYGQSVTFTATVTGDGTPFATGGTLTIANGSTMIASCTPTNGSTAPWTCSGSIGTLPVGTNTITATYTSDPNYQTASATDNYAVGQANATVAVISSPNPSTYGQPVNFGISITSKNGMASGVAMPTGSFTVIDCGTLAANPTCSGGTTLGTFPILAGTASFSSSVLTGGTHNLVVTYSGDTNYTPSN